MDDNGCVCPASGEYCSFCDPLENGAYYCALHNEHIIKENECTGGDK